jgi:OmpA-OmpF porin, OOP family
MQLIRLRQAVILSSILVAGLASPLVATADEHIKGAISARNSDGTLTISTDDASTLTVILRDSTKVRRVDGMRTRKMSSSSLIPGLRIHVSGEYLGTSQFVAQHITFDKGDMKMAQAIKGGVEPTDLRSLDNQRRLDQNTRTIEQQQLTLAAQAQLIESNRDRIKANQDQIVATTGVLNARIADLDNYKAISTVTVYFRNGKAEIAPQYVSQLQQLASQARNVQGYMIQVQGYASAVGSKAANQTLSLRRAQAVTAELQQSGVPLTNIFVPGAMGITDQVASNKTAKGQAENRRTVVTLLQNKGIGEK